MRAYARDYEYGVPERNLEPPDPDVPDFLECVICEVKADIDDFLQVHGKAICIWCADKIAKERN